MSDDRTRAAAGMPSGGRNGWRRDGTRATIMLVSVPQKQIRAVYTAETITVYQAYPPEIARAALARGRFVAPFKRERMTWIKPSFLWMMYRCGWASKPGQEQVLAIEIARAGFEWALRHACLSQYDANQHTSQRAWSEQLRASPVRVQWDPEHSLSLRPLSHRSLQTPLFEGGEVMDQVRQVVALVADVLGPAAVGTYLHGSAVLGGLRPASDVDVLVVSRRSLTDAQRRALLDGLLPISGTRVGARPVELTVVVQSEVRPWRFPPIGDFLYGEWLRDAFEADGPPRPEPMPDLALVLTMVLAGDRTLAGPPPARVLDPVPRADLVRAMLAGVPGLLDDLDGDTRNVVLTLARVWCTLATGEIRSKDSAAEWALARLAPQHRPVLRHARELYLTCRYVDERWSDELRARVRPCVDEVLARIDGLSH